jgi:hypothetical protein
MNEGKTIWLMSKNQTFEFTTSGKKNGRILWFDGHSFTKKKTNKNKTTIYWLCTMNVSVHYLYFSRTFYSLDLCSQKRYNCKSLIKFIEDDSGNTILVTMSQAHSHEPNRFIKNKFNSRK